MEHWHCPTDCKEHCCPKGCEEHKVRNIDAELQQEIINMQEDPVLVIFKRINWLTEEIKKLKAYVFDGRTELVDTRTVKLYLEGNERKLEHRFYTKHNELAEQISQLQNQIHTIIKTKNTKRRKNDNDGANDRNAQSMLKM